MFRRAFIIFIIISLLSAPTPIVMASDFGGSWAQAKAYITKEFILDTAARKIARSLLNNLVSGLIDKIQTGGRDGGPAFVQNWRNFQTDAQYRGENVFRSILASTTVCNYLEKDIKGLFNANQKISATGQNLRVDNFDPFTLRANCTLPSGFSMTNYQQDFSGNGGWDTFNQLLEPQNNYYGLLFQSLDEANRQRTLEESGDMNEALAGSGFTSLRDTCAGKGVGAKCTFLGKTLTPGQILGETAAKTIQADMEWLISADELSEVIIGVLTASINRLGNLALSKTSTDYASAPKITDPVEENYYACTNRCNAMEPDSPEYQSCHLQCSEDTGAPIPNPVPTEETSPTSPEPGGQPTSLLSDLEEERVKYSTPMTSQELSNLLNAVAWKNQANGWGLLSKTSGNRCPFASGDISCDILFHKPSGLHYDVLTDAENKADPTWSLVGPMDISRWVAPIQP